MLMQFKVRNFRSIRNELIFNTFVRGDIDPNSARHFTPSALSTHPLNTVSMVYGSNASGKSNLVRAIGLMKSIVMESSRTNEGDLLPYDPYAFSSLTRSADTEFEIEFIADDVRYQYGFAYDENKITEEWLFSYPNGVAKKWLMRSFTETGSYFYDKCDDLSGAKEIWETATRDNALFLSTAVQLKSEQLLPVFNWFKTTLRVIGSSGPSGNLSIAKIKNKESKDAILKFMQAADFCISDFRIEDVDMEAELKKMPIELQDLIKGAQNSGKNKPHFVEIKSGHTNDLGEVEYIDIAHESDGTQKVFELAGSWLDAFENARVLVMDEMNLHLHPNLNGFLVDLFYDKKINCSGSQLITTTHETNLLKGRSSCADQIWIMDRYKDGSSSLLNLKDFDLGENLDIEEAFIQGRFEGVPVTNVTDVIRARNQYNG